MEGKRVVVIWVESGVNKLFFFRIGDWGFLYKVYFFKRKFIIILF